MATKLNCKDGKCEIPLFTWRGKDYIVIVNEDVWKSGEYTDVNGKTQKLSAEDLYRLATQALPLQKNADGSQKYPEMVPRPKVDIEKDKAWINERLKLADSPNYLEAYKYTAATSPAFSELPPSQQAVKEWEKSNPLGKEFFDEMSRYGLVQGATYNLGEDVGLQGSIKPYKVFSQMYPGQATLVEIGGALPSGSVAAGLTRKAVTKFGPEALTRSAGFAERTGRFLANVGASGLEALAHMGLWRYGKEMPADPDDPFTVARLSETIKGSHAGRDYGLSALLGVALPVVGRTYTGLRQMLQNMKQRGGPEGMTQARLAESFIESLPVYAEKGIDEDEIWRRIDHAVNTEGMAMADAVGQTKANLDAVVRGAAPPVLQALPMSRDVGWAAGRAPQRAGLELGERIGAASQTNTRLAAVLAKMKGADPAHPFGQLEGILAPMQQRMERLYAEAMGATLNRDVFRNLIKPKGSWKARQGDDLTYTDKGWDDAIDEINAALKTDEAMASHAAKYGEPPTRLATRKEFLDNAYTVKSSGYNPSYRATTKELLDSGQYIRKPGYAPIKVIGEGGSVRYNWVLEKVDNTISPRNAQVIAQNIRGYLKFKDPKNVQSGAPNDRNYRTVSGELNAWNETIGEVVPPYRQADKLFNEMQLIRDSYELAGTPSMKAGGKAYDEFNQFIEEARKVGGKFDPGSQALKDAREVFYSRAIMEITGEGVTPAMILRSSDLQGRVARFIGNEDDFKKYMLQLLDEQAKLDVTASFPAPVHQIASPGMTSKEAQQMAPTFLEAAPSAAAMFAFSPAFAGGRLGSKQIRQLRGFENEATANEIIRRLMSTDRATKQDTVTKLAESIQTLRSPIETGMGATRLSSLYPAVGFEGGMEYGMPSWKRRFGLLE